MFFSPRFNILYFEISEWFDCFSTEVMKFIKICIDILYEYEIFKFITVDKQLNIIKNIKG